MKRLLTGLVVLLFVQGGLFASDLDTLTYNIFTNEIDAVARPNQDFNHVGVNALLGGFNRTGYVGYYHTGAVPFSFVLGIDDLSNDLDVSSTGLFDTDVSHPLFNTMDAFFRISFGLPNTNDLSMGIYFDIDADCDDFKTTSENFPDPVVNKDRLGTIVVGVPFGMKIGDMYNYARIEVRHSWLYDNNATETEDDDTSRKALDISVYDALYMPSILPKGTETRFTLSYNSPYDDNFISVPYETETWLTLTAGNRFDISFAEGVDFALYPTLGLSLSYSDSNVNEINTLNSGLDFSLPMALRAQLGDLPFSLFAGAQLEMNFDHEYENNDDSEQRQFGYSFDVDSGTRGLCGLDIAFPAGIRGTLSFYGGITWSFEMFIPLGGEK